MDTTLPIEFRDFQLNTSSIVGDSIVGSVVETIDYSPIEVSQFTEKRATSDGIDAGEITLGARNITLNGTLYAVSRPALTDALLSLRSAMNPKLAYLQDPNEHGFQPLKFSITSASLGVVAQMLKARPNGLRYRFNRKRDGGAQTDAASMTFAVTFLVKDAPVLAQTPVAVNLTDSTNDVSGTWTHRGDYPAPLIITLSANTAAGVVDVELSDGQRIFVTVPAGTAGRTILYNGNEKTLLLNGALRMDLMTFPTALEHPVIAPSTNTGYRIRVTNSCLLSGIVEFYEAWS